MTITVDLKYVDLLPKVRMHLSVIGKRAVNAHGERFFVELTASQKEEVVFHDLIDAGSETIVSELCDLCSSYSTEDGVRFIVRNDRWANYEDDGTVTSLTKALEGAINRYMVNFCVGQFLASVYPAGEAAGTRQLAAGTRLGRDAELSAVGYGGTYLKFCESVMGNIKRLAYEKRRADFSGSTYKEMLNANSDYFEDGKIISLLTLKRNGVTIGGYNGTEERIIDITVPMKVSEVENDRGYITGITSDDVTEALGYEPFRPSSFSKETVQGVLGIKDWALSAVKPSYEYREVAGLVDELSGKVAKGEFAGLFDTELSKHRLGHTFETVGTGNVVKSVYEDGNIVKVVYGNVEGGGGCDCDNTGGGDTVDHSVYMTKTEFAEYFEKYAVNGGWVIRAKKTLCSVGDVVAYGVADIGGGGGGGGVSSFVDLTEVVSAGAPSGSNCYWGWNGSGYGWIAGGSGSSSGGGGITGVTTNGDILLNGGTGGVSVGSVALSLSAQLKNDISKAAGVAGALDSLYIGTTKVQKSSAYQVLTGITSLSVGTSEKHVNALTLEGNNLILGYGIWSNESINTYVRGASVSMQVNSKDGNDETIKTTKMRVTNTGVEVYAPDGNNHALKVDGSIKIGGLVLKADGDRLTVTNSVSSKVAHVCASGDVVAYGIADIGGDKQQIDLLTSWTGAYDSGFALGAGLGVDLNTRVKALEDAGGGGGGASSWAELTGKPTTLSGYGLLTEVQGMIPKNYLTASDIQGKFVELTGEQTVAGVKTWSDNALFNGKVGIGVNNNSTAYALQVAGNVRIFNSSTSGVVINGEGGIDLWHAMPYINFKARNGDEKLELLNYIANGYSVARFEAENKTSALSLGGGAKVYWDAGNSAWRFEGNIIASGDVVAYGGVGTLAEIGDLEVTSVKAEEGRFTKTAYFGDMLVGDGYIMPSSNLAVYVGSSVAAKFISGCTVTPMIKIGAEDADRITSVSHQMVSGVNYICFQINGTNYRVKAETY